MKTKHILLLILVFVFLLIVLQACSKNETNNTPVQPYMIAPEMERLLVDYEASNSNGDNLVADKYFDIHVDNINGGSIILNKSKAKSGEIISLNILAMDAYELNESTLKYNNTAINNYQFMMPESDVVITAEFVRLYTINCYLDGILLYQEEKREGQTATYPLETVLQNKYYLISWHSDPNYTGSFSFSKPITNNTNIYGQKKYYPYNKISSNMNKQEWDSQYYFDITKNEVINAAVSYYKTNYFYLYIEAGQTAIVATNTNYLNMESNIMLAISGAHGAMLNGGNFINWSRPIDCLGHVGFTFQVTQSGYYYIAVLSKISSLPNFNYIYSICAVVE